MRLLLFTGKGGVGKTTLAAATAARLARDATKTLVVSTDPAHSLGDALGVAVIDRPTEVETGLFAAHIETRGLLDQAWRTLREHLRTMLAGAGLDELDAEELTVLPGIEELLALTEVARIAADGPWETVIVDCGPTAETLRLLALPEALAGYLERLFPSHRRAVRGLLGTLAGGKLEQWDALAGGLGDLAGRLEGLRALLTDRATTGVRLVLTPERVVAAETRRTITALTLQGIAVDALLVNRLVPDPGTEQGVAADWLRTRRAEQQDVLDQVRRESTVGVWTAGHHASEPVGPAALRAVADDLYGSDDPLHQAPDRPLLAMQRPSTPDGEYLLTIAVPLAASDRLDLARVGDELVVTIEGRRRLVALPSVLRRCVVSGAGADDAGLTVRFRPDPALWMR
ncbi:ArsA family ATPase [Actinoalloteichus hymeniacidonis]|uniref:Arsenite-activated ATPase ArsA n=1 Tax=Actinoalloteichus hymeniacidonis TaxID=340345 RepID=A0AAC9HTJ4_9PSEU|nr:ArsA family ATPase [Actinoalloteichus hymeniacidonis]AOS65125.1 arsenite-activated ATPase ArsA [Actinoalloteichus hymeniacidonis]MBB5906796.1 arsenite-transporting ATPase [Actinoalloteichus hymeniacidonis]